MSDLIATNHGSIVILTPRSKAGRQVIRERFTHPETQFWGRDGVVIEPRYLAPIVEDLRADGYTVEGW